MNKKKEYKKPEIAKLDLRPGEVVLDFCRKAGIAGFFIPCEKPGVGCCALIGS
jgi:hypothetical protein